MTRQFGLLLTIGLESLCGLPAPAQNLVPNSGFEGFTSDCDFGMGYDFLEDWRYLNCGSPPGLAHTCNNALGNGGGIPQNAYGYVPAHGGDAIIVTWTYRTDAEGGFPDGNPQRYANVDLMQPLVADQRYCIRLWINMADSSCYRTDAFHAFVGYGVPTLCNEADTAWDTYATATWDISAVDTSQWTLLESDFVANGGETNITLGAFQFDDEIHATFLADHSELFGALVAAYFIDDVELWACQVGVSEQEAISGLSAFPNPADDRISVTWSGSGTVRAALRDMTGRLVTPVDWTGKMRPTGTWVLSTSGIPSGQYVVSILRDDGSVTSRPIAIQH